MNIIDIIEKKRDKKTLTKEEINYFIENYTNGKIADYQASALLMAIFLNGMDDEETTNLALAMAKSGEILDLSKINGIDFEVTDIHGLTPFNYAIFLGRNKIAYFLFDYSNDLSMLSSLIDKGNMSFLEKLISKFHYRSFKLECIENE